MKCISLLCFATVNSLRCCAVGCVCFIFRNTDEVITNQKPPTKKATSIKWIALHCISLHLVLTAHCSLLRRVSIKGPSQYTKVNRQRQLVKWHDKGFSFHLISSDSYSHILSLNRSLLKGLLRILSLNVWKTIIYCQHKWAINKAETCVLNKWSNVFN